MDGLAIGGEQDWKAEGDGHADDEQGVEHSEHNQNLTKGHLLKTILLLFKPKYNATFMSSP